jgi:cyanophycinase-like exopeptidase
MSTSEPSRSPLAAGPGLVVLFGSGETSASGSKIFQALSPRLARPLRIAILETPAGFELNSAQVAGRVAEFLNVRLQNDKPHIDVVPARKRGTAYSPDDPAIVEPLRAASLIYLGAGSPTYAARQLRDSVAWHTLLAAHRLGAAVALASAAALAASAQTLPVYEIYKAGQDLGWHPGLDLLGVYGLPLVWIPHWNNAEGGADLDTGHCFMGRERFEELRRLLPAGLPIVGIDEHTGLIIDLAAGTCQVMGAGGVTVLRRDGEGRWTSRESFALSELGAVSMPEAPAGVPGEVWEQVVAARAEEQAAPAMPEAVSALVAQRQAARKARDWPRADAARDQLTAMGWQVMDTPDGPVVQPAADR